MPENENQMEKIHPSGELQINNPKLGHAYVPFQYVTEVYEPDQGLKKATIFPQLYMPYIQKPLSIDVMELRENSEMPENE